MQTVSLPIAFGHCPMNRVFPNPYLKGFGKTLALYIDYIRLVHQ